MQLIFALAWRNLWRNPRRTLLSASAVGTMVFLLIFVQSMQLGSYDAMVDHAASVLHGHAQIQRADYVDEPRVRYVLDDAEDIAERLRSVAGIRSATARAVSSALASKEEASFGALVVGVDPRFEAQVSWLPGAVSKGRYLTNTKTGQPPAAEAVIGELLASNLDIGLGDELVLLGVTPEDGMAALVGTVVGLLSTGQPALDRAIVHVPLGLFQDAFDMQGSAHTVSVMYENYTDADDQLTALGNAADLSSAQSNPDGGEPEIALWNRLVPEIEGAIESDRASSFVMFAVLVILATFSIANTFVMMLFERTREFGSLLAMGARPGTLRATIALETFLLASIGALAGAVLGALVSHYVGEAGISLGSEAEDVLAQFQMPERIYFGVAWPALISMSLLMIVTTQIAAFFATRRVHSMQIVQAIREEM